MGYGYRAIVVDTEARSPLCHGMMETAGGMKQVAGTFIL